MDNASKIEIAVQQFDTIRRSHSLPAKRISLYDAVFPAAPPRPSYAFTKISLGNANNMKTSTKDITLRNNLLSPASFKNAWAE